MTRLRVRDASGERQVPLARGRVRLGRSSECEVVVEDAGVSRVHATLEREGHGWIVEDAGSSNGTFVDDEQVTRADLTPGIRLRLGPSATVELIEDRAADDERSAEVEPEEPGDEALTDSIPPRATAWWIEVRHALEPVAGGDRVPLTRETTTVGRDPASGLPLDDDSVSRLHARLDRRGGGLAVVDLKSRNGTSVNGERVMRADLDDQDRVAFGSIEFVVRRGSGPAWGRLAAGAGAILVLVLLAFGGRELARSLEERAEVARASRRIRGEAVASTVAGIEAFRAGDGDFARAHLLHASDLLFLGGLVPRDATPDRPAELFATLADDLPEGDRDFDFAKALDPSSAEATTRRLRDLPLHEYVDRQVRRFAVELGQLPEVPPGFVAEVEAYIREIERHPGKLRATLRRARTIHPRLRDLLAQQHLPEAFCYVAWVESDLDSTATSRVGARGLWQFMPATARQYGLRVEPTYDERIRVERSTRAASRYIGDLVKTFSREQFMCALASYNRGDQGVRNALRQIPDTLAMMESPRKYWYLVEHRLLPRETAQYVPRIFATRVVAEDPDRFRLESP